MKKQAIAPSSDLRLILINDSIYLKDFRCREKSGSQPLETFLKKHAVDNLHHMLSVTYVAQSKKDNQVVGFFSLACGSINATNIEDVQKQSLTKRARYPAIYIGRLAVHDRYQGAGVGKWLLEKVFRKCIHISTHIGSRFIIVQSKPTSVGFYTKHGGFLEAQTLQNGNTLLYRSLKPLVDEHLSKSTEDKDE